jgi:tetratricopeptide (TPR) repeat protein
VGFTIAWLLCYNLAGHTYGGGVFGLPVIFQQSRDPFRGDDGFYEKKGNTTNGCSENDDKYDYGRHQLNSNRMKSNRFLRLCQIGGGSVYTAGKGKILLLLLMLSGQLIFAQEDKGLKARADELLLYNKPAEALPLYQAAVEQNPQDPDLYLNLGYVYELLGQPGKAVQLYQKGSTIARIDRDRFLVAMARNLHKMERFSEADEQYSRALEYNPTNYAVYLNRGNTRVRLNEYQKAINDYSAYLSLEREPSQETQVRQMITLLRGILEQEKAQALADEQRRKEEEARQQALLDSVLSSLDDVTKDTQSISAGAEQIEEREVEIDLID